VKDSTQSMKRSLGTWPMGQVNSTGLRSVSWVSASVVVASGSSVVVSARSVVVMSAPDSSPLLVPRTTSPLAVRGPARLQARGVSRSRSRRTRGWYMGAGPR
jgi:hypothetical protein